ncbi:DNA repair protein [Enterovibrio norvegicus]|uniref:DUF2802 domain-containing protein n=2 Tax=Enterovibrio norvegicus TaxID=188144 RepID=A0A1I5N4L1_9GAMM|nr:DUF2802 domain-containing protein [Enterovibrio norvegicus]MCC4797816.1 DUF2802 domain-containing protein [Enterovibrio norvegicus]OEE61950.1 DNA repair protein [Enterovibrio norvegicus]OEF58856.1 DNA repair protein [Enterovibrio norvegicus]OEF59575.1 DNA repair protein [Enterovibrio norvegicus]PMH65640.1 DNA repair protein [Enterovibrio norvegicus]
MLDVVLYWLPLGVSVVIGVVLFLLLRREKKARQALETKFQAMELVYKNARQQQESLTKQFNELRAGSIGMSQKLAELSQRFDDVVDKQNELEMHDPDGRLYSRASKMVELGADIHELMEECDLPKAEAELLLSIRKQRLVR